MTDGSFISEAFFFDLDGTLIDTAPDFYVVLNEVLADAGRPALTLAAIRAQVSNGARALVTLGFGLEPGDAGFDDALHTLLEAYAERGAQDSRLFAGMDDVIDTLDVIGVPWGIVTNKPQRFTLPLLQRLDLVERVGPVICPDHVTLRKPDPEGLLIAARQCGLAPETCVYVGDHLRDIDAGRRAGMKTVAALFGYLDPNEDARAWQADYYIESPAELLPIFHMDMPRCDDC